MSADSLRHSRRRTEHHPANGVSMAQPIVRPHQMSPAREAVHQAQLVEDKSRNQKVLSNPLLPALPEFSGASRISQQLDNTVRTFLDGVDEEPTGAVSHLKWNATGTARDDRSAFPERLGDDEPKSLPE